MPVGQRGWLLITLANYCVIMGDMDVAEDIQAEIISETAFQLDFTNVHDQKIRTVKAENETWGYVTRGKKIIDLQVGKML